MAAINYPVGMPYDELKIYDQSVYTEETTQDASLYTPDGLIVFQPIISPRGYDADNELRFITNTSQLDKFGTPNISKYGLSLYYAKNILKAGANLLTCRLVADNALPANKCVYALVKFLKPDENSETPETVDFSYNGKIYEDAILYTVGAVQNQILIFDDDKNACSRPICEKDIGNYSNFKLRSHVDSTSGVEIKFEDSETTFNFRKKTVEDKEVICPDIVIGEGSESTYAALKLSIYKVNVEYNTLNIDNKPSSNTDIGFIDLFNTAVTNAKPGDTVEVITSIDNLDLDPFSSGNTDSLFNKTYAIPLMIIRARCSGEFTNGFSFRIKRDSVMSTYAYNTGKPRTFYTFSSYDNGVDLDSPLTFTFDDDYIYNSESMFVDDVFEMYNKNIKITAMEQWYYFESIIHSFFKNKCTGIKYAGEVGTVDLLSGTYVDGKNCGYIDVDGSNFNFNDETGNGNTLEGGSDGYFKDVRSWTLDSTIENDPFEKYFTRAYNGTLSDLIFDEVRMPFRMIFSPTLNTQVNDAIHNLVNERKTTAAFYAFPTEHTTYDDMRTYKTNHYSFYNTFKEYFISEHAMVYDEYTHKRIVMPANYFNSYKIPNYWIKNKGKSFCGVNFYWDGYVNSSILPRTSKADELIANHEAGLNTMIEDGKGKASPYEQITAQTPMINSKLSDLNNVITLLEACSIALTYANERHWVEISDSEVAEYKVNLESRLNNALGSCWKSIEITTSQAAQNGAGRNRLLCKIYVTFKDILKGVSYEFYIL